MARDWSSPAKLNLIEKIQVELSDFITFQNNDGPEEFEKRVKWLQAFGRPVVCTGFLAANPGRIRLRRPAGVTRRPRGAAKTEVALPRSGAGAYRSGIAARICRM